MGRSLLLSLDDPLRDNDAEPVLRLDEDLDMVSAGFGSSTAALSSGLVTSSVGDGASTAGNDASTVVVHCGDTGSFSLDGKVVFVFFSPFNPLSAE